MSASKKGLGRSFSSLIPTELLDESFDPTAAQDEQISELRQIKLTEIEPDPDQPRRSFDEAALADMAASIAAHGVLQPIVVVPYKGKYQIVAGERRYRASKIAGLERVPALVRTLSNQHKLELSLIENLQRSDLNPLETATAYLKLRDQFNLSLEEIGRRVGGKSVSAVSNTIRLLRLPDSVRQAIADGKLHEGQARPLIGAEASIVSEVLPRILREEWSARKIEQFMSRLKDAGSAKKVSRPPVLQHDKITERIAKHFATNVKIKTTTKGAGKIEIHFKDEKDLERLEKLLG